MASPLLGITPLHLAAKCGSLDAALCLVGNKVDVVMSDSQGWAAIHHAAFYDQAAVVRIILRKFPDQMELESFDRYLYTVCKKSNCTVNSFDHNSKDITPTVLKNYKSEICFISFEI